MWCFFMSYADLYSRVQTREPKISTRWLRDQVIDLTEIHSVKEQWTGIADERFIKGWYIEGPQGPPVPLVEAESLIVLVRSLNKEWRRLVYTKELMHTFDEPGEKTDTAEKLDKQIEPFGDPAAESNALFHAEEKAVWRALAVLCPEKYRQEQLALLETGGTSLDTVAARLKIPTQYVGYLFRDNFLDIVDHIK